MQAKLAIGASNDPLEQEADRVADQVSAAPMPAADARPRIQRVAGQAAGGVDKVPASVERVLAGPGRSLGPALRQDMEQRFGHDFSRVRVHAGPAAEQSAREVNAHAYTTGDDIVFGSGRLAPETYEGRRLIAHELTHVVQQSGLRRPAGFEQGFIQRADAGGSTPLLSVDLSTTYSYEDQVRPLFSSWASAEWNLMKQAWAFLEVTPPFVAIDYLNQALARALSLDDEYRFRDPGWTGFTALGKLASSLEEMISFLTEVSVLSGQASAAASGDSTYYLERTKDEFYNATTDYLRQIDQALPEADVEESGESLSRARDARISEALRRSTTYMPAGIGGEMLRMAQDPIFIAGVAFSVGAYLALWMVPEPVFTKLAAILVTLALLSSGLFSYSVVVNLAHSWHDLEHEAGDAGSDADLELAAKHFGSRMGAAEADLLVFLGSLLVGARLPGPKGGPPVGQLLMDARRALAGLGRGGILKFPWGSAILETSGRQAMALSTPGGLSLKFAPFELPAGPKVGAPPEIGISSPPGTEVPSPRTPGVGPSPGLSVTGPAKMPIIPVVPGLVPDVDVQLPAAERSLETGPELEPTAGRKNKRDYRKEARALGPPIEGVDYDDPNPDRKRDPCDEINMPKCADL